MSAETSSMSTNGMPLVQMQGITRRFGTITALENVDFEVGYQEVVGLLGDNGAGKSTLIKVLTGVHPPTEGKIYIEGQLVNMSSPLDAHELGIETVYQDLALVPLMSISRNFYLGREPVERVGPVAVLAKEAMNRDTAKALEHIGIHIRNADEPVGTLSGGERQSIAIGRAVHFGTKLLILDEPTSALSIGETRKVISYTTEAKRRGLSVIFITHNIHHVFEVADRFTIISHGHKVGDFRKGDVTQDEVAGMIMGEPIPERLKGHVSPPVNTRPVEVIAPAGASAAAAAVAPKRQLTYREREDARRRRELLTIGLTALGLFVLLLLAYVLSRPNKAEVIGVPPLSKEFFVDDWSFKTPDHWQKIQSESGLVNVVEDAKGYKIQITWDSARNKNVSTSAPLSTAAKALQADDFLGLQFQPGADTTVGGRPAYRYEYQNPNSKSTGVKVIFVSQQNNFYEVSLESPNAIWESEFKPLADAIIGTIKFK